jgi:hypothetical protein
MRGQNVWVASPQGCVSMLLPLRREDHDEIKSFDAFSGVGALLK